MNRCHQLVSGGGHDAEGVKPVTLTILPSVPKTGKRKHGVVCKAESERLFCLRIELFPLVEKAGRDDASAFLEWLSPSRGGRYRLSSGIDGRNAFDTLSTLNI